MTTNWTYDCIWFEQLEKDTFFHLDYGNANKLKGEYQNSDYVNSIKTTKNSVSADYLIVEDFKSKNGFCDIEDIRAGDFVRFNRANVKSFSSISALGSIKRLELNHCVKLSSADGLSELASSLQWLHVSTSKKFFPAGELLSLKNLRVLSLNNCGDIDNLDFLNFFPNLIEFNFLQTKLVSGDLTPLFSHKNLLSVRFLDAKHYSHKYADVKDYFDRKSQDVVDYAYKGQFVTHRYKDKFWL